NWNDHFFWVDEFVVPASARFGWFSGTNIVKDRAPTVSEYNVEHANTLIAQASPFLRFPEEFLCWVGISRNYLFNKDTYPRFEYEGGEEMDLNAFIRTTDPLLRPSEELSDSVEREFGEDVSGSSGGGQENASVGSHDNVEPISEDTLAASHPPKKLRADYEKTSGSATGDKSPSVIKRLLRDSQLMVEQGIAALPTLPFITSSVTASPLEEGGDHTDSATYLALRTIGPSERFVVLSDSSHHSSAKSADAEVDSLIRSVASVITVATTLTTSVSTATTTIVTPADVGKDKNVPTPSIFAGSSSSEKTDRTLSLFTGRSGSDFVVGDIRAEGATDTGLQEIYVPGWFVTRGFELNDGRSCADMIDHFTPPTFFKAVRGIEHEQLFAEFNVSPARNLSFSSEVKDKEIESLEAIESSLRGEVASAKEHSSLLEKESNALNLKATSLESTVAEKDHELSDLETSSSSLSVQNQSLVNQVHELEVSSAGLREKLETYKGSMKQLEEFQDKLMEPLKSRLAEINANFIRCCMHFQETFHPYLLNTIEGRRWALGNAFGRAIEKGIQEGLAAGIEHGHAGRCLNDLETYNPSAEADFNSAIQNLRGLDFPLFQELSAKKDASIWDVMNLLRLDDAVAKVLGMTNLQPDVSQLMVLVCRKQEQAMIGSQVLSVALDICHGRVQKIERNLIERLPFLKDVFVSIDHPLFAEALTTLPETPTEPLVTTFTTTTLSPMVVRPSFDPSLSMEDYENPDLVGAVLKDVIPEPGSKGKVGGSTGGDANVGDFVFSKLENEARNAAL
ncbi:hypothetical protein Tco_0899280, partial [Tanacetum coccineum]